MYRKVQKKDYVVVMSPIGKMGKIEKGRLKMLPKDWREIPKTNIRLYRADGGLQEKAIGLLEIKNKGHIDQLSNPIYYDYGMTIGKIMSV